MKEEWGAEEEEERKGLMRWGRGERGVGGGLGKAGGGALVGAL